MNGVIAAVLVLGVIVVIHELGHFLAAKCFGIKVETFSVGFGPRIAGFRRGETDYRISAFPLGGYVKMNEEIVSKSRYQRFLVAAAGPIMNVLLAIALLTGLFMDGKTGFADALERSIETNTQYSILIFNELGKLARGQADLAQLAGPIGIVRISSQAVDQGFATLIMLMVMISLNLAVMNVLPIPLLDGGVMFLLIVEIVMGRDLSVRVEERIAQVGLVALLCLTAVVLYNDIVKWVTV